MSKEKNIFDSKSSLYGITVVLIIPKKVATENRIGHMCAVEVLDVLVPQARLILGTELECCHGDDWGAAPFF